MNSQLGNDSSEPFTKKMKEAKFRYKLTLANTVTQNQELKLIVLGPQGTGKTSIIHKFRNPNMTSTQIKKISTTIGTDFVAFDIEATDPNVKKELKRLNVWDTAGQERFRSIASSYIRNAHAVLLVCSIDNPKTIKELESWNDEVNKQCNPVCKVLVVNKMDIESSFSFDLEALKLEYGCNAAFLTSAASGQNIQEVFHYIADYLMDCKTLEPTQEIANIQLNPSRSRSCSVNCNSGHTSIETGKLRINISPHDISE